MNRRSALSTIGIVAGMVLIKLYLLGSPQPAPITAAPPIVHQITWSEALAHKLGNQTPSPDTLRFIDAWIQAEGTAALNNPLATTQNMQNATDFNSVHVKNYASIEDGLNATVLTLQGQYAGYSDIVAGIQTNDVTRAFHGLSISPWGTQASLVASIYNGAQQPVQHATGQAEQRSKVIELALSQVGKPYVLGTNGPDTFDCSGLVQWAYAHIGIDTGRTTFDQLPKLRAIEPNQVQPGDMVYFQYPWDQHTGILADVDGDGAWDLIEANAPGTGVIVTSNVFSKPFYTDAIIGYRSAF